MLLHVTAVHSEDNCPAYHRDKLAGMMESLERREELARQFSTDSGDAVVLLKQGKRDEAVSLLAKMRSDYLDITAPQYVWTSKMLSRHRR